MNKAAYGTEENYLSLFCVWRKKGSVPCDFSVAGVLLFLDSVFIYSIKGASLFSFCPMFQKGYIGF